MISLSAIGFTLFSAFSTILGAWLALNTKLRDISMRYLLAFASGVMIGVAFFDMMPESQIGVNSLALGLGFFSLYVVERLVMIHACGEEECSTHRISGWASMVGVALESFIDGVAIAAGFAVNTAIGLLIAVAVVAHETPRGFSTAVIMRAAKAKPLTMYVAVAIDAFTPLLGVFGAALLPFPVPVLLAFTAGTFTYIGAAHLMPESHRTFNLTTIASVLIGAVSVLAVTIFTKAILPG